ncbi:hypothetical protein C8J56DRAFT_1135469 [Mycena floridula]|nr:hypothetical protein C8J56DRAFT_1135469 [Mycena floridula]
MQQTPALTSFPSFTINNMDSIDLLWTNCSPTYGDFVVNVAVPRMTRHSRLDQSILRQCIGLSSSFLVTDTTTDPERGLLSWQSGFSRLVDLVVALHATNELELDTVDAAVKSLFRMLERR